MHGKKTTKKIALVTGANRGIGFETCKQLSQLDITVLLTSRDTTKGEVAAKQLTDKGLDVIFFQLDVSDRSNIKDIFTKIKRQFGCLDILINNAAILYDKDQSTMNADLELVNKALTTNLFGPWLLCQAFIPLMEKNGYGRVVNVSSGAASMHYMEGGTPAYGISKVALNVLTRKLASELGRKNVLVNSVDPGWVATDMGGHGGRPIEDGCRGIVWAATLPNNGPSGGFFHDREPELW